MNFKLGFSMLRQKIFIWWYLCQGLGISFLRHIERCRCLLFVLDMTDEDSHEQLEALGYELEQYTSGLSKRPHGVIANKMDLKESKDNFANLTKWMETQSYFSNNLIPISAKDSSNIIQLLQFIKRMCHDPSWSLLKNIFKLWTNETIYFLNIFNTLFYFLFVIDSVSVLKIFSDRSKLEFGFSGTQNYLIVNEFVIYACWTSLFFISCQIFGTFDFS